MFRPTLARLAQIARAAEASPPLPAPPLATAVPRKHPAHVRPFRTADQLLAAPQLQQILSEHAATADAPLPAPARVAVLAHLSAVANEPVASSALPTLRSAADMAAWYSRQLRPLGARGHAARLIHATLLPDAAAAETTTPTEEREKEAREALDERIALDRDAVQKQFEQHVPPNLILDPRTFSSPEPLGMYRPIRRLIVRPTLDTRVGRPRQRRRKWAVGG